MPLPRPLRVLPRYLNPILRPIAGYLPPLAVLHHVGRKSGLSYDTPVQGYPTSDGFIAAYAYSENPAWAQNLVASGKGQMTRGGKHYTISNPRRLGDEGLQLLPKPVASMMRSIGVHNYLQFDAAVHQ